MNDIEQTRVEIDRYEAYVKKKFKKELIVSYDCSNKDNPFRAKLHSLLKTKSATPLNESLYKLPPLNEQELLSLANEIGELLNEILITESANVSTTKVIFITPDGTALDAITIINHEA